MLLMNNMKWRVQCSTMTKLNNKKNLELKNIMMQYIEAFFQMEKETDVELWYIEKIEFMKAGGKMTTDMEEVWRGTQMETSMKVTSSRVRLMEKEFITGQMVKYMTVNGQME